MTPVANISTVLIGVTIPCKLLMSTKNGGGWVLQALSLVPLLP